MTLNASTEDAMKNSTKTTCELLVAPNMIAMMSAAKWAHVYPSGRVVLTYTDGTTEEALLRSEQIAKGRDQFLSLVSAVQARRATS